MSSFKCNIKYQGKIFLLVRYRNYKSDKATIKVSQIRKDSVSFHLILRRAANF